MTRPVALQKQTLYPCLQAAKARPVAMCVFPRQSHQDQSGASPILPLPSPRRRSTPFLRDPATLDENQESLPQRVSQCRIIDDAYQLAQTVTCSPKTGGHSLPSPKAAIKSHPRGCSRPGPTSYLAITMPSMTTCWSSSWKVNEVASGWAGRKRNHPG